MINLPAMHGTTNLLIRRTYAKNKNIEFIIEWRKEDEEHPRPGPVQHYLAELTLEEAKLVLRELTRLIEDEFRI